jgi:hypothetical protein
MTVCMALSMEVSQVVAQQNQIPNRFPFAAAAGVDSKARQSAPPGAVNQGPFDADTQTKPEIGPFAAARTR